MMTMMMFVMMESTTTLVFEQFCKRNGKDHFTSKSENLSNFSLFW